LIADKGSLSMSIMAASVPRRKRVPMGQYEKSDDIEVIGDIDDTNFLL
jgi:hypothetical protein